MEAVAPAIAIGRTRRWLDRAVSAALLLAVAALLACTIGYVKGYRVMIDRSDSMQPAIAAGDLIVNMPVRPDAVAVGDIVTFVDRTRHDELVTHRVIRKRVEPHRVAFVTRGDANTGVERWSIESDATLGRFVFRIPKAGSPMSWVAQPVMRLLLVGAGALFLGFLLVRRIWHP